MRVLSLFTIDKRLITTVQYHSTMETTDRREKSSFKRYIVEELTDSVPKLKQERSRLDVNVVYTAFWDCELK